MHDFPSDRETNQPEDRELIRRYSETGSEEAFGLLMQRHLTRVYSVCRRDLRDTVLADDAAQVVFLLLSRKARALRNVECLSGWLFQTARLVCRNLHRQRARVQLHEAPMDAEIRSAPTEQTVSILAEEPLLLAAMDALHRKDLHAILLRFFEEREFTEIGQLLGISEDAARMRVNRALVKMRVYLTTRGIRRDSEEDIAVALAPTAFLVPVSSSCPAAITRLTRTAALADFLSLLPAGNRLRPTFEGVIRTMHFQTIRPVAATFAAVGLVSVLLIGIRNLQAEVAPLSIQTSQTPAPIASPAETSEVIIKFRLIEKVTSEGGTVQEKVLNAPTIIGMENQAAMISFSTSTPAANASKWVTEATPHCNNDGTISLQLVYRNEESVSGTESGAESEETVKEQKITSKLRLKPGKAARVSVIKGAHSEFLLEVMADKVKQPDNPKGANP